MVATRAAVVADAPAAHDVSRFDRPWLGLALCLTSLGRYALQGERTPWLVHDNLDSVVVWQKLVSESGLLFGDDHAVLRPFMGGIERAYFDSELNVFSVLNALFSPFQALLLNHALVLSIAYVGMWWLVRRHLEPDSPSQPWLAHGVAASFALLPHWPGGGLSVAGMPLLLHAFLELRRGRSAHAWRDWAVFALFPFYSSIVLCFAVYLVFGAILLADLARGRWHWRLLGAIVLLTLAYALVEHRLLGTLADASGGLPHRVEFKTKQASLLGGATDALQIFLRGQYHAPSLHTHVILPLVGVALLLGRRSAQAWARLWILLGALLATSLVYGVLNLAALEPLRERVTLLRTFNFGRVHWLQPLLWYAAFAVAVGLLDRQLRRRAALSRLAPWVALLPLALQLGDVLWQAPKAQSIGGPRLAFEAFYAPELFQQIKDFIALPPSDYRVVSVGMHPAVSQYNGFYTLDGYLPNYPLSYKHQFRRIIAPELARNDALRAYFDDWGSRAYVFSSDLYRRCASLCTKDSKAEVRELRLDTGALFEQGGRYVLSAVPIRKADGLTFLRRFDASSAAWSVYLYGVVPPAAGAKNFRADQPR